MKKNWKLSRNAHGNVIMINDEKWKCPKILMVCGHYDNGNKIKNIPSASPLR